MSNPHPIIGSIVERKAFAPNSPYTARRPASGTSATGFPSVQHRSKSAFARNREEAQRRSAQASAPPTLISSSTASSSSLKPSSPLSAPTSSNSQPPNGDVGDLHDQISKENERLIAGMSPEEIEEEKRQILERFGADIGSVLEKARRNRIKRSSETTVFRDGAPAKRNGAVFPALNMERTASMQDSLQNLSEVPISPEERRPSERAQSPPTPALSSPSSRPPSRADRRLRFAELDPKDVFVYESVPSSPKRRALALPPPTPDDEHDPNVVSLGTWKGKMVPQNATLPETQPPSSDSREELLQPMDVDDDRQTSPMKIDIEAPTPTEIADVNLEGAKMALSPQPSCIQNGLGTVEEEGTPEDIRRRFFPDAPVDDPSLDWMRSPSNPPVLPSADTTPQSKSSAAGGSEDVRPLRFDLRGDVIPTSLTSSLPTHLGLHHHAEGDHAGYTLDDVFLLTRSTVPQQRMVMMGVLRGICELLSNLAHSSEQQAGGSAAEGSFKELEQLKGQEETLRKRIAAVGIEAMAERGNVGIQAIDLIWQSLYAWDGPLVAFSLNQSIYLERSADETVRSLPTDFLLDGIAKCFNLPDKTYPPETLKRLGDVVKRLATQNGESATNVVRCEGLVAGIATRLLFPSQHPAYSTASVQNGQGELDTHPDPQTIHLMTFLVKSSRENAEVVSKVVADGLLRFVVFLPSSPAKPPTHPVAKHISPYPISLAKSLLKNTLDFYAALAEYGLWTHVASSAMEELIALGAYIYQLPLLPSATVSAKDSTQNVLLLSSWLALTRAWTTCAIDPHATTPPHDITWSRVEGWGWHRDILCLIGDSTSSLGMSTPRDWDLWGGLLTSLAVWLEGSKVNGVRGGEAERAEVLRTIRPEFGEGGRLATTINLVVEYLGTSLSNREKTVDGKTLSTVSDVLASAIRLWAACLPPHLEGPPSTPPFDLPYARISSLSALMVSHQLWDANSKAQAKFLAREERYDVVHLRKLSNMLSQYLKLSRRMPDTTPSLWLAQALSILVRLSPGDEDVALSIIEDILKLVEPEVGAKDILGPFLEETVLPTEEDEDEDSDDEGEARMHIVKPRQRLAPLLSTPASIQYTTTQVSPSPFRNSTNKNRLSGLPLPASWFLTPLSHLLHSGDSPVFKHLPKSWDYSELDVVRASLGLAVKGRSVLNEFGLGRRFAMGGGEAVLGCMEVFMLEHGLAAGERGVDVEVFRDEVVERLMSTLLQPYRASTLPHYSPIPPASSSVAQDGQQDLESIAPSLLGPNTPFYQFYTDFVGLYDAISFSHPLFAQLLIPPISMKYPFDYRRLFWCDYSHVVRTVFVEPGQVLIPTGLHGASSQYSTLSAYLYPVEQDPQVIGAYLSALLKGTAKGFLKWVALHHTACSIWEDLWADGAAEGVAKQEERAVKLCKAIVVQGGRELFKEVLTYSQTRHGGGKVWPDCFEAGKEVVESRRKWARDHVGTEMLEKIGAFT